MLWLIPQEPFSIFHFQFAGQDEMHPPQYLLLNDKHAELHQVDHFVRWLHQLLKDLILDQRMQLILHRL